MQKIVVFYLLITENMSFTQYKTLSKQGELIGQESVLFILLDLSMYERLIANISPLAQGMVMWDAQKHAL